VPALEQLHGLRVVADPDALDRAIWAGEDVIVLRIAPDEAFGVGAVGVVVDEPDAVVEPEAGFVGVRLSPDDLERVVTHLDWPIADEPGVLAQGKVAGVPAKILTGEPALLVTQAAYALDLADRLGWLP
jgi:hypothetical protein